MDDHIEIVMLYDFYGGLLTEKQRTLFEMYYMDNLSLGEISEIQETSRQAVFDIITRVKKKLLNCEKKVGYMAFHAATERNRAVFAEIKLFQVKPDKLEEFEDLAAKAAEGQLKQPGAVNIRYMKRFYAIDGVEPGSPPRELTKAVKCVKYYSYWEFDGKESYGKANEWFFANYSKEIMKLLVLPFDINIGDCIS
ncbi:MAG: hypothetical protein FWE91_00530 [Defluviitaleaceae bacterium]|nr:hypothetical protein [Defluviitaleaceae bacterium]MCL2835464.1 hypothetical protein [Defluviitaleaceae bacterium]